MALSTHVHEARIRVRYAETDAMGVVHHSAYVPWLEVGRVEWLRSLGMSYADFEREGYALPVVEMHLRFVAPARFDDALKVRTALWDVRSRGVRFSYEVLTDVEHPRQLANGMTRHICMQHGVVARLPALLAAVIDAERPARPTDRAEPR